jgi:ABC-type sugar transport system permease subunit
MATNTTKTVPSSRTLSRGSLGLLRRVHLMPFLFLAPLLLILAAFRLSPMFYGVWLSFTSWTGVGAPEYIGLTNYRNLFSDPAITVVLRNNIIFCLALLAGTVVPLAIAIVLDSRIFGWKYFRIIFFIPVTLSPLVIGLYWASALEYGGPIDAVLKFFGLGSLIHLWLIDPTFAIPAIAAILIWSTFGFGVVLFMAAMATINPSLYDAAAVDGAKWWQVIRHVTIPALMPVIVFWCVGEVIFAFTSLFAFIYSLTAGGPGYSTSVVEYAMYASAFQGNLIGYGSAIGVFMLLVVFTAVIVVILVTRRRVEEANW